MAFYCRYENFKKRKVMSKSNIYIVFFEPDGVPQTIDGKWAEPIEAFEGEDDAMAYVKKIKEESLDEGNKKWDWLGRFEYNENTESDDTSSRGLRLSVQSCPLSRSEARS
jgi:hypothetical protein